MRTMLFRNFGGIYQLRTEVPEDLEHIQTLKPARWVITSAPLEGFQCDPKFLEFLDFDQTGRIRTDHVRAAQAWLFKQLAQRERLAKETDAVRLADIDTSHSGGAGLRRSAQWILTKLNLSEKDEVTLEEVRRFRLQYARTFPNGDGVVPPELVEKEAPEAAQYIRDIMQHVGSIPDASELPGIGAEQLNTFVEQAQAYLTWMENGNPQDPEQRRELLPFGDETREVGALFLHFEPKIEQFFAHCDLVRLDEQLLAHLTPKPVDWQAVDIQDPDAIRARLATEPLATPNLEGRLEPGASLNPYYRAGYIRFLETVLARVGTEARPTLDLDLWEKAKALFAPYRNWLAQKPAGTVGELGAEKLEAYLHPERIEALRTLVHDDLAVADELEQISNVEKLVLYQRWLMTLASNFVNVSHLYDPKRNALFETGQMILDGRELAFTMRVPDRAAHKKVAESSHMFVVYAEISDRSKPTPASADGSQIQPQRFEIAAAVTRGVKGGIEIGKRGVFFDTNKKEWDAQVVDIIANPISLWEAIRAPFDKCVALFSKKAEAIASSSVQTLDKTTEVKLKEAEKGVPTLPAPAPPPAPAPVLGPAKPEAASSSSVRELMMGGSIAFAAVGSSLAFMLKTVSTIQPYQALGAVGGLLLVVVIFGALLGLAKLRKRDLAALLEASGWAVNYRMRLTRHLGRLFTRRPDLPENAQQESKDLVRLFLRQIGDRDFSWKRIGIGVSIALVLFVIAMGYFFPEIFQALWSEWLGRTHSSVQNM